MVTADERANSAAGEGQGGRLELILERVGKAEDSDLLRAIEDVLDRYLEGRTVHA